MKWITASDIKNWANVKQKDCAQTFPELIRRLIFATAPASAIQEIDFPSGDSTASGGWDGRLKVADNATSPFFPSGSSAWEIGAEKSSGTKAEEDYVKRTADPRGVTAKETTYVCVTPRTFPERDKWQEQKQQEGVWKDVRVIAADSLEVWLDSAPAVALWLARRIGNAVQGGTRHLEDAWNEWSLATNPQMTGEMVIAGRAKEAERVQKWIAGRTGIIAVQGDAPDEALAFLYASIAALTEQDRVAALSRCVVVENLNEFRAIQAFRSPLIIAVPGECVGAAAAAVAKGHQVYISMDATVTDVRNEFIKLSRPQRDAMEAALQKSGLSQLDADKLARDFGRSIPVLHRNLAVSSVVRNPSWTTHESAMLLLPALFAGSWTDDKEGDRKALETLSGKSYEEFTKGLGAFLDIQDAPLRKIGSVWTFKSPLDAWFLLARHLDDAALKRFKQVVHSVLTETDPKYELEAKDRWAATVYGKISPFSEWLRTGLVESLILLAVFGNRSSKIASTQAFVNGVVNEILGTATTWEIWSSLKDVTPLLAEAAPDTFLAVLSKLMDSNPSLFEHLMGDEESSVLFGECKHSGLLWALESLAWSPDFFAAAAHSLAALMRLDPGGRWSNRPEASLREVFLPGHPQTHGTPEERVTVIRKLAAADPSGVWKFAHRYFSSGVFSESHRLQWRDAGGARRGLQAESREDHEKYVTGLKPVLRELACAKENWVATAADFIRFPPDIRDEFVRTIAAANPAEIDKDDRDQLRTNIRGALNWINTHGDEKIRACAPGLSDALEHLAPADVIERLGWLIGDAWPRLPRGETENYAEHQKRVSAEREKAAREMLDKASIDDILVYAKTVKHPGVLGYALAKVARDEKEDAALVDAMSARISEIPVVIEGYTAARTQVGGQDWVRHQLARLKSTGNCSTELAAMLLGGLPEGSQTWDAVAAEGTGVEEAYWKKATGRPCTDDEKEIAYGIRKLLDVNRPYAALEIAGDPKISVSASILKDVVKGILAVNPQEAGPHNPTMDDFYMGHVFKKLHEQQSMPLEEVAALEWPFAAHFGELARYTERPFVIHRLLQKEPLLFAQLISFMYKRDDGVQDPATDGLDQKQAENRAHTAREVIDSWTLLPGLHEDGSLDEDELSRWVKSARSAYAKGGRVTGGDLQIGLLLARAPADPDGAWPHIAVRNLLEDLQNDVIEKHIPIGIYNGRGSTTRGLTEGGVQERKLSEHYKKMGEATKTKWPRTAAILRSIVEWYESDAEREDVSAELNDLRFG